jgi:ribosomal protein L37E
VRCQWHWVADDSYRCEECGTLLVNTGGEPIQQVFDRMPDCGDRTKRREEWARRFLETHRDRPSAAKRAKSYLSAVARWIAAGRPVRSDEEVTRLYEELCRPCGEFDPAKETCTACGCRVRKGRWALLSKLKMATESCPRKKFTACTEPNDLVG